MAVYNYCHPLTADKTQKGSLSRVAPAAALGWARSRQRAVPQFYLVFQMRWMKALSHRSGGGRAAMAILIQPRVIELSHHDQYSAYKWVSGRRAHPPEPPQRVYTTLHAQTLHRRCLLEACISLDRHNKNTKHAFLSKDESCIFDIERRTTMCSTNAPLAHLCWRMRT